MTDKEAIEGDKSIREFMDHGYLPFKRPYSREWKYLMGVVEKIENLPIDEFHGKFGVHIASNNCTIQGTKLRIDAENFHPAYFNDVYAETNIEATWLAVVKFVKWHNEQLQYK